MTKEEILDQVLSKSFGDIERSECIEAMEEYAKQECVNFAQWIPENAVIEKDGYGYLHLKDLKPLTVEKLYQLFLQSKSHSNGK